jgi:hypothetical protein
MNWHHSIVIAFGCMWLSQTAVAQVADSIPEKPAPQPVRSATPPKRGAKPTIQAAPDASANAGKIEWSTPIVDFGEFDFASGPAYRELKVTNLHSEPLQLLDVKTSCHCTTVDWSNAPIAPGNTAILMITYTPEQPDEFYRIMTIRTNFDLDHFIHIPIVGTAKGE